MNIKSKLFIACFLIIEGCIFHENCFRDITGKIDSVSIEKEVILVISKHDYKRSKWYFLDSLRIKPNQGKYNLHRAEDLPQRKCHNDCPDGEDTMADSIRVKIIEPIEKQVIKDTVFTCADYTFNGDDIELPTITLP